LSAMPRSGAPPTIGDTPTTTPRRAAPPPRTPGTRGSARSDAAGFKKHDKQRRPVRSLRYAGRRLSRRRRGRGSPSRRRFRRAPTQYSWKSRRHHRSSSTNQHRVGAGSSSSQEARAEAELPAQLRRRLAQGVPIAQPRRRRKCVARSSSPRPNHAPLAPRRRSFLVARTSRPRGPTSIAVRDRRRPVHDGVDVRRHVQAVAPRCRRRC